MLMGLEQETRDMETKHVEVYVDLHFCACESHLISFITLLPLHPYYDDLLSIYHDGQHKDF